MENNGHPERGIHFIPTNDYRKDNTNRGASITRDPVIPLLEEDKKKAIDKEIVIDFNNKIIKAKDPNTGEFVEFNNNTIEKIYNEQGLRVVLLDDTLPVPTQTKPDFKSIDIIDGVISIHGFDDSYNMKIPAALHGEVIWTDMNELTTIAGNSGHVEEAFPGNNNLFVLGVRKAQVSDSLPGKEFNIVIPNSEILNDYMRIVWKINVDDEYLISFPPNTHFECTPFIYNEDTVFDQNTIYIVNLETFDRGKSWFCSCRGFEKLESDLNVKE